MNFHRRIFKFNNKRRSKRRRRIEEEEEEEEEEEISPHTKKERNMASRVGPKFGKVAVHNFPLSYYYKVATASFVCGGIFEAFMIHT